MDGKYLINVLHPYPAYTARCRADDVLSDVFDYRIPCPFPHAMVHIGRWRGAWRIDVVPVGHRGTNDTAWRSKALNSLPTARLTSLCSKELGQRLSRKAPDLTFISTSVMVTTTISRRHRSWPDSQRCPLRFHRPTRTCLGNDLICPDNAQSPSPSHHRMRLRCPRDRDAEENDKPRVHTPASLRLAGLIPVASSIPSFCAKREGDHPMSWDQTGRHGFLLPQTSRSIMKKPNRSVFSSCLLLAHHSSRRLHFSYSIVTNKTLLRPIYCERLPITHGIPRSIVGSELHNQRLPR